MKKTLFKYFISFTILFGVFSLTLPVKGQSLEKLSKRGLKSFESGNYVRALEYFQVPFDSGWHQNELANYMAQCYFELHQPDKARQSIERLDAYSTLNVYNLAFSYYYLEQFNKADNLVSKINLSDSLQFKPSIDIGFQHGLKPIDSLDLNFLTELIADANKIYCNGQGYIVQNFGANINSHDREYNAVMDNGFNSLLFTARREADSKIGDDGLAFETMYSTTTDTTNRWKAPLPLKIKMESENRHDATVQVYAGGNKMISYHNGRLYTSEYIDSKWQIQGPLKLHNLTGNETHCFITDDEKTIYFASDYLNAGFHLDLFKSTKAENGTWNKPIPLKEFNTEYDEDSPFMAKDGTFYFSSRGHNSIGGYDIFKSKYNAKTQEWATPVNLGYPINTVGEDTYYSTEGKLGYISSSRKEGYGSLDLYRVFLFNKVKIQGQIIDEETDIPIPNVQIKLDYSKTAIRSFSDINGNYEMYVPINTKMDVTFVKDSLDIYEGDYLVNVYFKDENDNEYNFLIDPNDDAPQIDTDFHAKDGIEEIRVSIKNDFNQNSLIDKVPDAREKAWADSINKIYEFKRHKAGSAADIGDGVLGIRFDFDSYHLNEKVKSQLDSLYSSTLTKKDWKIDIIGHTDTRGSKEYNLRLSILRANSVSQYLEKKGINSDKILIRGKGSNFLLDSDNSELSHQRNRRVEIKYY